MSRDPFTLTDFRAANPEGECQPLEVALAVAAGRWTGRTKSVDLNAVTFSSRIDFVTVKLHEKIALPALKGKPIWSRSKPGRLSIHDLKPADMTALAGCIDHAELVEIEVAVDVRPRPAVSGEARVKMLEAIVVDLFASELDPNGRGMLKKFRAAYRRLEKGYRIAPFNLKLPHPHDQQLHGGRVDDCQVKVYLKRRDQRVALTEDEWVARVEVRLCGDGLSSRGLTTFSDIAGFRFRKQLMPFFTHINGSRRLRCPTKLPPEYQEPINARRNREDQIHFERHGVGGLKGDWKVPERYIRLTRDIPVNARIGQALMRLEKQFRAQKIRAFVNRPADG